ncbi:LacI family transcriptional regulator [Ruminococcaceae bacterium OttesenSCG-928-D13]|nr:LacI family transcriptional regulator [Ruminococcaceae bacterium OttesenSCG-928-D13]
MATRRDVAKKAKVSEATVSYVLNNTKPLTPEVRQRVLKAVEELNYRPNLVARSLASNHTRHVALLVENLQNPYFMEVLEGAQQVANEKGYIISTLTTAGADIESMARLIGHGVEGAILTVLDGTVERYVQRHLRCVLNGEAVKIDYGPAVYEMVDKLVELGHESVAFLAGIPLAPGHARYEHLAAALAARGLALDERLVVPCTREKRTDEAAGYEATRTLLARKLPFTALFAVNDLMAIGAIRALAENGLSVPGDVSVIGCDNIPLGRWLTPSLSTIHVTANAMGRHLMEALIDLIEKNRKKEPVLPSKFICRETVAERKRQ